MPDLKVIPLKMFAQYHMLTPVKRKPIPQGSGEAPPGSRCLWSHPCGGRTWEEEMIEWRLSQTLFFLNLPVQSKDWDPDAILDKLYIVHQLIAEKRRLVCKLGQCNLPVFFLMNVNKWNRKQMPSIRHLVNVEMASRKSLAQSLKSLTDIAYKPSYT